MTQAREAQIRALYRDIREGRLGRAEAESAIQTLRAQAETPLLFRHGEPYLRDHTINGEQVLIGVTYAALAARRFETLQAPLVGIRLRRLLFVDPVVVPDGRAVTLRAEIDAAGACRVEARLMDDAAWVSAATCEMEALRAQPDAMPVTATETLPAIAAELLYQANPYVVWGPSFKTIVQAAASSSEAILHLHLPASAHGIDDPLPFALDPRVLNGVLFGAFAMLTQQGQSCALLPLSVGQLDMFVAPACEHYRVAVHLSRLSEEMLTVAAEITDDTGRLVAVWRDFGLKRMVQEGGRRPSVPPAEARIAAVPGNGGSEVRRYLQAAIARVLGQPVTDGARNLLELGLESRHLIALAEELRRELDIDLLPTVFFEYPSLDALVTHFEAHFQTQVRRHAPPASALPPPSPCQDTKQTQEPIAIIGMAGRLAQSPDLDSFWQNMAARRELITEVPAARWDAREWFDTDREAAHKSYCKWGSFIEDIAAFDPLFFNISPQQALWLDPQARHLLEAAYHAAEDAGCSPQLRGSRTGVFAGVCFQEYWDEIIRNRITLTGHEHASSYRSSVAAHISYALDLRGPSLPLDNACASSLSALHLACQSLRLGECDMAFACGVNLLISPLQFVYFSRIQAMSPSGRCHTFDRRADGFVPGEGAIALLLKPLAAAERDGDPIHAVIRGSAINHTGRSPNPTAPRPETQTDVLRLAWERAGILPRDLSYIECHGTGTQLGDPIEINALKKAFGDRPGRASGCVIGSVKAHIGHLEGAAGLAGVVKVVQSMKHGQLLRMPHFQDRNPMIELDGSPLRILTETERWDDTEGPRIAGISGFGMTGNGAHVVLQAYPAPAARADLPHGSQLILLSAKDGERLRAAVQALRIWLEGPGEMAWLPDIAHSLQVGRENFVQRLAFIAHDRAEMRLALDAYLSGSWSPGGAGSGALERLRDAFLAGERIDGAGLAAACDPAPRRISLPGYAFAREDYWFTKDHGQKERVASVPPALSLDDLLIQPVWTEAPLAATAASAHIRQALLVTPRAARDLAEAIAAALPSSLILAAEAPVLPEGLERFDTVFFLGGAADPEIQALRLAQALGKVSRAGPRLNMFFLLANSFPGMFGTANPAGAGLCGLAYALAQSDPRLAVRNIDLGDSVAPELLVAAILREPADPRGDLVRLDGGRRYRRIFEPVALPATQAPALRQGGVYVLIGGAGTVGSVLTPWLLKTYQAKVIWIGRRSAEDVHAQRAACAAPGGILDYVQADATDPAQLRAAVEEIGHRYGTIHGAIYAPVVFSFANSVAETSEAEFRAILDVKTKGSVGFYEAFKNHDFDFLCFFSSCQSFAFSGAARLSAYAAGICFADSYAASIAQQARFPVGVINWGFWRAFTAGSLWRQYQAEHPQAAMPDHIGFLEDAEGIACFERFVAHLRAQGPGKGATQIACLRQSAALRDLIPRLSEPLVSERPDAPMTAPLRDRLAQLLGEVLLLPPERIADDTPFAEYGIDSITSAGFVSRINAALGCAIGATVLYDYPTLSALTGYVGDRLPQQASIAKIAGAAAGPDRQIGRDAIAVIGMALQVPDAHTPDEFWALLRDGAVAGGPLPASRFTDAAEAERYRAIRAGSLDRRDVFDPLFFHISPREAEEMSPYQRLMLQEAWRCLEDSGCNPKTLAQSETGVFIGAEPPSFGRASLTGGSEALIAARISYFLNLKGPALVVNTGCSSSAVALHLACESLRRGESRLALAGGIFADLGPEVLGLLSGIGMISPTGVCRPFDARADGTVISEGLAMVALKPLDDALADGDPIRGVIIASAMNQDGASNGITAPNGRAQEAVLRKIYHPGGIDPASISYVEAHGTGTVLGDPIEVNALGRVFAEAHAATGGCRLGSAKANIGHASAAAGVIGLIKILLSMAHETIPALPGFEVPNPKIDLTGWRIGAGASPWPPMPGRPRRAALNAFGHSGTNVHIVVEEAMIADDTPAGAASLHLVPLSANDTAALRRQAEALRNQLLGPVVPPLSISSLAWTLQTGRMQGRMRLAFVVTDLAQLRSELARYLAGDASPLCWQGEDDPGITRHDRLSDAAIMTRLRDGDVSSLARYWVCGGAIDWGLLHPVPPRKVSLPGTIFAEMTFPPLARPGVAAAVLEPPPVSSAGLMRLPVWRPHMLPSGASLSPGAVTILRTSAGVALAEEIAARERALGATVLVQDLVANVACGLPGRIYILAWVDDVHGGLDRADCTIEIAVLTVIQQLRRDAARDAAIDLFVLTRAATGPDAGPVHTGGAGAAGLAYALAQSDHRFRVRNLDLIGAEAPSADTIMTEPASHRGERIRLGQGGRFGLTFPALAPIPADLPSGLRQGGTYVIAGGAGTVGSVITRFLIRDYQARVIWLGRSAASAAKVQARLAPFAGLPNPPLYLQADVTDAQSLATAIVGIRERGWIINGAIFSSLVFAFDDGLDRASEAGFHDILEVKLAGGLNFCRALAGQGLDFLCYFSSGQAFSFSGATQFASYAAAMTAADSWALRLAREEAYPIGVLNWGFWKSSVENERLAANIDFIEDEAGFHAFRDFITLLRQGRTRQVLCLRASPPVLSLIAGADGLVQFAEITGPVLPWSVRPDPALGNLVAARQPEDLESWMARILLHRFQAMGVLSPGVSQDVGTIQKDAGIVPKYQRWLQEALGILHRHDLIRWQGEAARADQQAAPDLAAAWAKRAEEMRENLQWRSNIDLLDACLQSLPQILRGVVPATEILFPGGSAERVAAVYSGNALFDSLNGTVACAVSAFLDARLASDPRARARIIEIGAGTGGTTKLVLPHLGVRPDIADYVFTDISRSFLINAEARFKAAYPYFKTDLWNIEQQATPPRIAEGAYDIVIATNVLHATRNMAETLRHAKNALKAGGLLLINEITAKDDFGTLTFGLLDGWWLYDDVALRVPGAPLLSPESWVHLLAQAGFSAIRFLAGEPGRPGHHVIAALSDGILLPAWAAPAVAPLDQVERISPATAMPTEERPMADTTGLREVIRIALSEAIKLAPGQIGVSTALSDYGVDSILGIGFIDRVNAALGLSLNPAIVFEHPTVEGLARHVATLVAPAGPAAVMPPTVPPIAREPAIAPEAPARRGDGSAIAIIGMAGQFPDAVDIASFWRHARDGHDAVRELPPAYLSGRAPEMRQFKWGGFLAERDAFDPLFFAITPREAESMSPHQRLVMQEGWKALEDAAIDPRSLDGKPVGLFVGAEPAHYLHKSFSGQSDALVASRLAYMLNLRGPALVVNTGCSSSGVALHLACESLRRRETDLALAGGVCANLDHADLLNLLGIGMLSPSGKCHSFSAEADGTVMSEAVGMVVLKRLDDALRDGDPVHACIIASGVNQDGASNGITAPNGAAQEDLIRQTYERFGIRPETIDYVETHGTGTPLGDVVEANALTRAFAHFTDRKQFCDVGSAKSHVGHSSAASGVVGLIHSVMAMQHGIIPGLLHFTGLNPLIEGAASALRFGAAARPWERRSDHPRMAALNCFGHSGSNAHFVLREASSPVGFLPDRTAMPVLVPLSARNEGQLREVAQRLHDALLGQGGEAPGVHLARLVAEELAALLDVAVEEIAGTEPLIDIGAQAHHLVALRRRLEQRLGHEIPPADMQGWTSLAAIVATLPPQPGSLATDPPDLPSVAMTMQSGRSAMAVRAIVLVSTLAELRERLVQIAAGSTLSAGCWTGRADSDSDLLSLFGSDEDLTETIAHWASRGRLDKVAAAWSRGMTVDWRRLQEMPAYRGARRLHLPAYPFARERYRKPGSVMGASRVVDTALGSALLQANISDLRGVRFASNFAASEELLRDHRVGACAIMPAAAAIEMAAAGAVAATRGNLAGLSLRNLAWSRKMEVAEADLVLHTQVTQRENPSGLHIAIAGADGAAWFCGDALWQTGEATAADLPRLQQCYALPAMEAAAFYDAVTQSGVDLGPGFRLVTKVHRAEREEGCLTQLIVAEALAGSLALYGLHPCLIDAVLQTVIALQGPQAGPMLPFSIDRLDILAETRGLGVGDALFVWSRPGAVPGQVDIDLLSPSGMPLVLLRGVMMRAAQTPLQTPTQTGTHSAAEALTGPVLLAPVWTMLPRALPVMTRPGALLVAGDIAGVADGPLWGAETTLCAVMPDQSVAQIATILAGLERVEHILWLAPQTPPCAVADSGLIEQQQATLLPFFRFVKVALQAGFDTRNLEWTVITRGGADVVAGEVVDASHASLHGLVGSLAKEAPAWRFRILDLGWQEADKFGLGALLAAPHAEGGEPVALRGGDWFVRQLVPIEPMAEMPGLPLPPGVIVVIGGAGGIGTVWSEAMIRRHAARIVWIGRRACDAGITAAMARLGQFGPAPVYVQADATDPVALQAAVARIRAEHGPIGGLVHSAIVLADQTMMKMTEAQLQAALRPKVDICVRMAQAFAAEALDFVLFFSSVQSFLKMPGQGNYAAGSCFTDGFAAALRQAWPCRVKVMNWGYWGGVGIVSAPAYRERMQAAGMGSIEPDQAMMALDVLCGGGAAQIALMTADKPLRFTGLETAKRWRLSAERRSVLEGLALALPEKGPEIDYIRAGGDFRMAEMEPFLRDILAAQLRGLTVTETAVPLAYLRRWLAHTPPLLAAVTGGMAAEAPSLSEAWREWDAAKPAWLAEPSQRAQALLVEIALRALPDILSGARTAPSVLMPEASLELVEAVYRNNLAAQYFNLVLAEALVAVVGRRRAEAPAARLRILEIGAGTGATSAVLFRMLAARGLDQAISEYLYTDISHAFLAHAQDQFGPDVPYLRTARLDIDRSPVAQGIAEGAYDIVIAANSLHTTRDIRRAVHHAKSALTAGGILLLNEINGATLYGHLTFGLLEGWWLFDEPGLRIPGCPGLSPAAWTQVLRQAGFSAPIFPAAARHDLGLQIILAESDGMILKDRMPAASAPVLPATAPLTPRAMEPPRDRPDVGDLLSRVTRLLTDLIAEVTRIPVAEILPGAAFEAYGIDSIVVIDLAKRLRQIVPDARTTLFFEHQSVAALAQHLAITRSADLAAHLQSTGPAALSIPQSARSSLQPAAPDPVRPAAVPSPNTQMAGFPVAVIGLAGRYPQAENLEEFWANLAAGRNCITEVPAERWAWQDYFDAHAGKAGAISTRFGGFIKGIDRFDPLFFGIAPVEAETINPQERLFLQTAWACVEEAGYRPEGLNAQGKVGVFVGVMNDTYHRGAKHWSVANRVSYHCNFQGPSLAVDTACSSSLTALHLALESLQGGSCGIALVGGVNLITNPLHSIGLSGMRVLAQDDRNKTFAADADGFVDGEGIGAVLLKPLARAVADGDHIHGVIRGSAINSGGKVNGYTVPNPRAQAEVVAEALARAHVHPRTISYVEAHGTGTVLGDPIEVAGLAAAFARQTEDTNFCAIGSVKSNIGHGESSAGIAGLTKILLQMKHGQLVPSLHALPLNPEIDFARTPFHVQTDLVAWETAMDVTGGAAARLPRRAGLSSFGAGGANAHVVIEEYHVPASLAVSSVACLLPLSARTPAQLRQIAANLRRALARSSAVLADIAFTLQQGRVAFEYRLAFVAADHDAAITLLDRFLAGETSPEDLVTGQVKGITAPAPDTADLRALARAWTGGAAVEWPPLDGSGISRRRVSLPSYPFAEERCWAPDLPVPPALPSAPPVEAPVLRRSFALTGAEDCLRDHQVAGTPVLPGVAYLNFAWRSLAEQFGARSATFTDVVWSAPFRPQAGDGALRFEMTPKPGTASPFTFTSTVAGEELLHCRGRVAWSRDEGMEPQPRDLPALAASCRARRIMPEQLQAAFRRLGVTYGPSHLALGPVALGEAEALAPLAALDPWVPLHPGTLDSAFQAGLCFIDGMSDDSSIIEAPLPFALRRLEVLQPLTPPAWVHVSRSAGMEEGRGQLALDLELLAADGTVVLRFGGLSSRTAQGAATEARMDRLLAALLQHALPDEAAILPFYGPWLAQTAAFLASFPATTQPVEALWRQWNAYRDGWLADPALRPRLGLLEAVLPALGAVLTGARRATEVLFPNGSLALVEPVYRDNPTADAFNTVLAESVARFAAEGGDKAGLRILEIGAGTGGTTRHVLAHLRPWHEAISQYCYTDRSQVFLAHGTTQFAKSHPFLTCQILDIEQPIAAQGLREGGFDIVIAANVLHATRDMRATLRQVRACLRDGGLLVLNELSGNALYAHVSFGLLEGWWGYDDPEIRLRGSPGLEPESWARILAETGFAEIAFPAETQHGLGQQIVLAKAGSLVPDVVPPEDPMHAARDDHARFLRRTIRAHVARSLKIAEDRIEDDRSFSDYGVDSILAVNLVNDITEAVGAPLITTVVFDHNTVERLARYILETYPVAAPAARPRGAEPEREPESEPAPVSRFDATLRGLLAAIETVDPQPRETVLLLTERPDLADLAERLGRERELDLIVGASSPAMTPWLALDRQSRSLAYDAPGFGARLLAFNQQRKVDHIICTLPNVDDALEAILRDGGQWLDVS